VQIQYNTTKLKTQWNIIAKSQLDAIRKIISEPYLQATGLNENDPPELWRFAIGHTERMPGLTKEEAKRAKAIAENIRQVDAEFVGDPKTYQQFKRDLGTPTLHKTVWSLAERIHDDETLAQYLSKLLDIYKRGRISLNECDQARTDNDNTIRLLLQKWIQEPFGNITGSLAFFSDRAMAKLVYYLARKIELDTSREEAEIWRVKKLYQRLELIPARPRAIRDIKFRLGKLHFIPFKAAVWKDN
jgi:hypothetical protein